MLNIDELDVDMNLNTEEYDTTDLNLPAGLTLYKQQKQVLGLMLKLERQRFININGTKSYVLFWF